MKTPKHIVTAINTAIQSDNAWRDRLRSAQDIEELRDKLNSLDGEELAQAVADISVSDATAEYKIQQAFDFRAEHLRTLSRALRDWRSELAAGVEQRWMKASQKWCQAAGLPEQAATMFKHSSDAQSLIDELKQVATIPIVDVGRDGYVDWRTESIHVDRVERAAVSDSLLPSRDGGQQGDDSNLQEVLTNLV